MRIKVNRAEPDYNDPACPPQDIPDMPWDLGEITDEQLIALFSEFTAWANFLAVTSTTSELVEDDAMEAKVTIEARYMLTGSNATKARAERDVAQDVQDARKAFRQAKRNRKHLEALRDNCVRSANAASRELTRRLALVPMDRRNGRLQP